MAVLQLGSARLYLWCGRWGHKGVRCRSGRCAATLPLAGPWLRSFLPPEIKGVRRLHCDHDLTHLRLKRTSEKCLRAKLTQKHQEPWADLSQVRSKVLDRGYTELLRIYLPRTPLNKGKKRRGRGVIGPGPRLSLRRYLLPALP